MSPHGWSRDLILILCSECVPPSGPRSRDSARGNGVVGKRGELSGCKVLQSSVVRESHVQRTRKLKRPPHPPGRERERERSWGGSASDGCIFSTPRLFSSFLLVVSDSPLIFLGPFPNAPLIIGFVAQIVLPNSLEFQHFSLFIFTNDQCH